MEGSDVIIRVGSRGEHRRALDARWVAPLACPRSRLLLFTQHIVPFLASVRNEYVVNVRGGRARRASCGARGEAGVRGRRHLGRPAVAHALAALGSAQEGGDIVARALADEVGFIAGRALHQVGLSPQKLEC